MINLDRYYQKLMPALLCLALIFSQAFGIKHGYDHARSFINANESLENVEQLVEEIGHKDLKRSPDSAQFKHSCIAIDAVCTASFFITPAYVLQLKTFFEVVSRLNENTIHFRFSNPYFLTRAPPLSL